MSSLREIVVGWIAEAFPQLIYGSVYEYRVLVSSSGGRLDLAPVKTTLLGALPRLEQWSLAGSEAAPQAGTSVVVAFLDADQTRPIVLGYGPLRAQGGAPTTLKFDASQINMGDAIAPPAREGDLYTLGTATGALTRTPIQPHAVSKVKV